eukprot:s57_g19.t1
MDTWLGPNLQLSGTFFNLGSSFAVILVASLLEPLGPAADQQYEITGGCSLEHLCRSEMLPIPSNCFGWCCHMP